ncbi:MAG TPA: aminotransferase class V-fold PLP-dependent enzyme [Pirellulaceae bacterium]|nr:aminotransferase class V-fold PLP-dependent enzyme [Pirellulaceae bacterium]
MKERAMTTPDWNAFRREMPIADRFAYFDHAAVAPLPRRSAAALTRYATEAAELGDTIWPQWAQRVEEVRRTAARLIAAEPSEIALVPNTTAGINLVAEGYPWQPGDNVVVPANEFPSNLFPWLNLASRGVEVRQVAPRGAELSLDDLFAAVDDRTRIITVSWVGYATGWRIDIDELHERAHARGVLVFLDAIQGLGIFPLDVRRTDVDFLAADGHKWLLGPEGAGLFYIRQNLLDRLRPLNVGWHSVPKAHDFSQAKWSPKPEAQRYEGGSQNMAGMIALGASLDLLVEYGAGPQATALSDRLLEVTTLACEKLQSAGARIVSDRSSRAHSANIVAFEMPGQESAEVRQRLWQRDVNLSVRHGWLRIAPHVYTNTDDLERLVSALA